jgi:hypothetical protein
MSADILGLLVGDLISIPSALSQQWGLFSGGSPVVLADSIIEFEYKQNWTQSTYPIEQGSFTSYDKVANPFTAQLIFAKGGSDADREAFLSALQAIAGDYNLYDIVTPDAIYLDVNIGQQDYRRTASEGNGLIQVAVQVMEIRESATTTFTSTQSASGSDPVNDGTVQTTTPSASQQTAVDGIGAE